MPPLVVGSDQPLVGLDCSHQPYASNWQLQFLFLPTNACHGQCFLVLISIESEPHFPIRPSAIHQLRLFSRGLDDTLLLNCLGPAQSQDHMRTSCRCSGAVGWLVKEPGSRMPLVTSSSAVTDFSFSLLGRVKVCLPSIFQGERTPLKW